MVGHLYTWEKSRVLANLFEECLDRLLASQLWLSMFENALVLNMEAHSSDHSTLMLDRVLVSQDFLIEHRLQKRRIRFENSWLKEPDCKILVTGS